MFVKRIKKFIKNEDILIRVGGDEFIIILLDVSSNDKALEFSNRLKSSMIPKFKIDNIEFSVTTSIGFSIYPDESINIKEILSIADSRMYADKKHSKINR